MAACLMLDHLGQPETAARIRAALDAVVREGTCRTADMGGRATTREFTDALVRSLA
jgi:isocitrate/isopropylmalate dehydrogenase